jgi:hypothetical protein
MLLLLQMQKTPTTVRNQGLDKFYTIPIVAEQCLQTVRNKYGSFDNWNLIVEPGAGNGSFLTKIDSSNKIGLDIHPEHPDVIEQDFFEYTPVNQTNTNILVIGNPPFGKCSSLAIRFFNHSANWASVIAFIIPKTFRRISVQNKLNLNFHLAMDEDIPMVPCSFTPPLMVKCCFQIWERRPTPRSCIKLNKTHPDWVFLSFGPNDSYGQPTPPDGADFAVRAYGGKCGEIVQEKDILQTLRPKSWHWIKCETITKQLLIDRFNKLDYATSLNTARQNSIGRGDFVSLYVDFIDSVL